MTEDQVEAMLEDAEGKPNVPMKLPGTPGTIANVSPADARERRMMMSQALANGVPMDMIVEQFGTKLHMDPVAVKRLVTVVRAMWDDEDAETMRFAKGAARRRYASHIREAVKDRKWTAVGNLEAGLAAVEGTAKDEEERPVDVDARYSEALLRELGKKDTKEVRVIIERQRTIIELGPRDPVAAAIPAKIVNAQ